MNALESFIADAGWHDGSGWHGGHWWIIFPILWLLLAGAVVALLWRRNRVQSGSGDSARQILGERFARGEIGADEYRERLNQLQ